jgi:hypothetical protein
MDLGGPSTWCGIGNPNKQYKNQKSTLRPPGIEPGSITWQATIITTRPRTRRCPGKKGGSIRWFYRDRFSLINPSRWTSMDDVSITVMSWWTFQQGDVSINVRTKNWRLSRNRQTAYECDISIPCKPRRTDVEIHRPNSSQDRFGGFNLGGCFVSSYKYSLWKVLRRSGIHSKSYTGFEPACLREYLSTYLPT